MCIDNAYFCNAKKKKKKVVENKIQLFNVCKSSSSCSMSELAQLWEQQNVGVRSKKSSNETKILNISSNHTYNNQFWTPPFPSIEFLLCPFKLNHIFVLFNPVERRTQQDVKHCWIQLHLWGECSSSIVNCSSSEPAEPQRLQGQCLDSSKICDGRLQWVDMSYWSAAISRWPIWQCQPLHSRHCLCPFKLSSICYGVAVPALSERMIKCR